MQVPGAIAGVSSITIACGFMSGWAICAIIFVAACMKETREEQLDSEASAGRATAKGAYELVSHEEEHEQSQSDDEQDHKDGDSDGVELACGEHDEEWGEGGVEVRRQEYGEIA